MGGEMRKHRLKCGEVKIKQIQDTDAKIVFVPCHNCIDQIRDLIKERDLDIQAIHFKEAIAERMEIPENLIPKENE
jgi:Fe-S oxidoreductase